MQRIAVHVHDDSEIRNRLDFAVAFTRFFEGHLSCLQPVLGNDAAAIDYYPNGVFAGSLSTRFLEDVRQADDRLQAELEKRLARSGVFWSWERSSQLPERALSAMSLLSDLLVMSRFSGSQGDEQAHRSFLGRILGSVDIPVLQLPEGGSDVLPGAPVIIAWNGSEQSARALRQTLPLLKVASEVTLFGAGRAARNRAAIEAAAEYLSAHGISADVHEVAADGEPGAQILNEAQTRGAGFIVMGAYGRARLAERLLGGTTQHLLTAGNLPVIFGG